MSTQPDNPQPVIVRRRRRASPIALLVAAFLPTIPCAAIWYFYLRETPPEPQPSTIAETDNKSPANDTSLKPASGSGTESPGSSESPDEPDNSVADASDPPAGSFTTGLPQAPDVEPSELTPVTTIESTDVPTPPEGSFAATVDTPQELAETTQQKKQPVPDDALLDAAQKQVRDLFREKFSNARTPQQKHALAVELYQLGIETKDDPASQYTLLNEAIELAVEVGDFPSALRTIGDIGVMYEVDRVGMALKVVQDATSVVRLPADAAGLTEACIMLADFALEDSRFDVAGLILRIATTNASRSKIPGLRLGVTQMKVRVAEREKAWEAAEEFRATLEASPEDPAANEQLGIWLAFIQNDWDTGRKHLMLSDDALLRVAVEAEINAPVSADHRMQIAEKWQQAANDRTDLTRTRFLLRASHWLSRAAELTTGLKTAQVQRQINELDRQALGSERTWLAEVPAGEFRLLNKWGLGIGVTGNRFKTPITVEGKQFPRGLGTHPQQDGHGFVRYALDSKFRTLVLKCSMPDGAAPRGNIQFSVIGDGKLLWWSRRVNKDKVVQNCQVSVRGVRVLELRVAAPENSYGATACWLDPFVLKSEPPKGLELY